jgi:hypothetical protein
MPTSEFTNSFIIHGKGMWGGCMEIQNRLYEFGICRYMGWDPSPPHWRFLYDTFLTEKQIKAVLGPAVDRWQVSID